MIRMISTVVFILINQTNCSEYLSLHPVLLQSRHHVLHDLIESEWHVVRHKVHCLQGSVREESILSKQGINSWLKSFALHTDL